jgi:WD40 repeat protein/serine/threonine protein kinase
MSAQRSCLDDAELRALLTGTPGDAVSRKAEAHLSNCAACRERLSVLAGGGARWFAPRPSPSSAPTPQPLLRAMEELKARRDTVSSDSAAASLTGTRLRDLGDYEILEELGRGGMGVVFRARQASLRREVALKVIMAGQLASPAAVQRFHVEAEAAAKLDHPNIVPIFEIGEHGGHHFFSMKLVEGGALGERMAGGRRPMAHLDAARLLATIARAVHHAHQRGVLHRDLKPSNVLLDAHGQPHLTDFGLAKMLETDSGLTLSHAIMGTPSYMAPEVAAGNMKQVTTAADVYSLGAVLHELLTGRPPFTGDNVHALLQQVREAQPSGLRLLNPAIPRDLETICLKCLEKEPARRYASAEALADDLDAFCQGEPIAARPVTPPERLWRWCRRKPALAATLAALHLVFALGLGGVLWQWRRAEVLGRNAHRQRERAEVAVFHSDLKRAEFLLETERTAQGLAQLARQLRHTPTNQVLAERLLNALTFRAFCLPLAPLRHDVAVNSPKAAGHARTFPFDFDGVVVVVNFSRDGSLLVSAGKDGTARVWAAATGESVGPPLRHRAEVVWADFDAAGGRVVTASLDGTAQVWSARTGDAITPPLQHEDAVWFAAFSEDGQRIVTASDDRTARLWDGQTGQSLGTPLLHERPVYFAAFSPASSRLLTAERDGPARLWDSQTGDFLSIVDHQFRREIARPFPQFDPGGDSVAASRGRSAGLWRTAHPRANRAWLEHEEDVTTLAYSPNGQRLATASHDGMARIWDVRTGTALRSVRHQLGVVSVQFSDDGTRLLTGARDRTARLWDVETGQGVVEPLRHEGLVFAARLRADGHRIATLSGTDGAWLWEASRSPPWPVTCRHAGPVRMARFDPASRRVVSIGEGAASLFDAATGERLAELTHAFRQEILATDFAPDGRLATATAHGNTVLWTTNGMRIGPPMQAWRGERPRESALYAVSFGGLGGRRLVTASEDGLARVWNTQTRTFVPLAHSNRVNCVRFSPDGNWILTASWDETARLWDAETGQPVLPPFQHEREVDWADFDPTGRRIATASKDKLVRLWSVQTGKLRTPPLPHADVLAERHPLDFSPDGTLLATVAGPALQVWSADTGQPVTASLKLGARLNSVRFAPDGARVVTASEDGSAQVWDARTGHVLSEPLRHKAAVTYAEFSPDGTRVLTCSRDGTAKIWPLLAAPVPVPIWLPELAEALAGERMDEENSSQPVSVEALYRLRQQLTAKPAVGYYERWAAWFFAEGTTRESWPR